MDSTGMHRDVCGPVATESKRKRQTTEQETEVPEPRWWLRSSHPQQTPQEPSLSQLVSEREEQVQGGKGQRNSVALSQTSSQLPRKQPRQSSPPATTPAMTPAIQQQQINYGPQLELSEENLRKFNGEEMISHASSLKRSSSRRSTSAALEMDTVSSPRSYSAAQYRYKHLKAAQVYIHADPPDDILAAINTIVAAEVSKERYSQLSAIAQEFHLGCKEAVRSAVREDDFLELLLSALKDMGHSSLCLRGKADWREELKPTIPGPSFNFSIFANFNARASDLQHEVGENAPASPRKRQQQAGPALISPSPLRTDISGSMTDDRPLESETMPPPPKPRPIPNRAKELAIKTPRPDVSIGLQREALISALSSEVISKTRAEVLLQELQTTTMSRKQGDPAEPLLIAMPTQSESDLVFPFAVIEAKAYATGKQIFEAENQSAVAGASALKILLSLYELVTRTTSPDPSNTGSPLFFSICTEGPYHTLYAHYPYTEDGVQKFAQTLVETCNGMLLKSVVNFIVAVYNVLRWGTSQFLDSVVKRLEIVAREAGEA